MWASLWFWLDTLMLNVCGSSQTRTLTSSWFAQIIGSDVCTILRETSLPACLARLSSIVPQSDHVSVCLCSWIWCNQVWKGSLPLPT
jgi:hypothetical protein